MGTENVFAIRPGHPTLLRVRRGNWLADLRCLPLAPWKYDVSDNAGTWSVLVVDTGECVYAGPGPVEVTMSRAPF